ncbi:MAG: M1 family metallopeptidase [Cyclobacteriaceae bacterium]
MRTIFVLFISLSALASIAQNGYWQQRVEYNMDIDFDVNNHQFTGSQSIKYYNNSPDTLTKVFYHLYFNAFQPNSMMDVRSRNLPDPDRRVKDRIFHLSENEIGYHKIDKLTQNGQVLDFLIEGTVVEVDLASPVPPNSTTMLEMDFNSQVPVQIRRSGRNNSEGISYSMAQWFPKLAEYDHQGWQAHPYIAREFYAPWGDYNVNITIDKDFVVAASGILQNPNEIGYGYEAEGVKIKRQKGKTLTWQFKAENVHDFMWAADPDYTHTTAQVPNGPELHFFYQTDTLEENWKQLPQLASKAFEYLNDNFGKYPYPVFMVIQGGDGGMEYPMSTLITGHRSIPSLLGVTVHEALHSWYQGVLATNESYLSWMDEGYTSYATSRTMANVLGGRDGLANAGNYRGYYMLAASGKEEPQTTHSDQFETNFAYGMSAYSKGSVSISQLGYIIGDSNRDRVLKRYFNEWKFKHPKLNDFVRIAEKESGMELDWYYDYWIKSTKQIDYAIDTVTSVGQQAMVSLKRIGKMPMPLDIVVTKKDGTQSSYYIPLGIMRGEKANESGMTRKTLPDWYWTHPEYEFTVDIPLDEISSIEIDSSQRMADVDRKNNKFGE